MEHIKIEKYEVVAQPDGTVKWYAITGKKRYEMPSCYANMYNDEHLAIKEVTITRPSLYDGPNTEEWKHYIPLRT